MVGLAGLFFAGASTFDFVQHLDRQMHDLHCSFVPGLLEADDEETGCQVTLLSPYSSLLRTAVWGGIPISLPAMAIFALLVYRAIDLAGRPAGERRTAAAILLALSMIPVGASAVMGGIAWSVLGAACKLCIGIYICSGLTAVLALAAWMSARRALETELEGTSEVPPASKGTLWLAASGHLFAFTAVPVVGYALAAPDHGEYVGKCGGLSQPDDPYGVMVELGGAQSAPLAIEVFDPLCPACKGFEERFAASGLRERFHRRAVMFPLDSECNWMVSRSLHPGACRVSEAVLCAATNDAVTVDAVVQWAFAQQTSLTETAKTDPEAVTAAAASQFPALRDCLQSADVKSRLNKSLRWTVANELTVLTPQIFVDSVKLCDEDTDLGLEYTLARMLELHDAGKLAALAPPRATATPELVPGSEAAPSSAPAPKRSAKAAAPAKAGQPAKAAQPAKAPAKADPAPADPAPVEPSADPPPADAPAPSTLPSLGELPPPAEEPDDPQEDG
jgi:uncharacterized membrane protein